MSTPLKDLPDGHVVAVDTETSGLFIDDGATISVVSFAYRDPADGQLVSKAVPFDQGYKHNLPAGPKVLPSRHEKRLAKWSSVDLNYAAPNLPPGRFLDLLRQLKRFHLIWHNAKFDLHHMRNGVRGQEGIDLEPFTAWDTQIVQNVVQPRYPTSLKPSAVRLELTDGGEDEAQAALKPYLGPKTDPRFDLVPWPVMRQYAAEDAVLTVLLYEWQTAYLEEETYNHLWKFIKTDLELMRTLYKMEVRGVPFNAEMCSAEANRIEEWKKDVADSLPFRVTPPGAKRFFFGPQPDCPWCEGEDWGCKCVRHKTFADKRTDTCRKQHPKNCLEHPQLDDEVQARLAKAGVPHARAYEYHESLKSALSKWYGPWQKVGKDGRLRGNFRQTAVVTGRLSAERINLLAIPKDHQIPPPLDGQRPLKTPRQLMRPRDGWGLWDIDVEQAEVRVGCAIAECHPLLENFSKGIDAHTTAAMRMFGLDQSHPDWAMYRRIGKTLNLAIQYGAGVKRIQAQLAKDTGTLYPLAEVKDFVKAWHVGLPEMSEAIEVAEAEVNERGYVRLWNGRFRWYDHERGGPPEFAFTGFNGKCQGGVAEVMKLVQNRVERWYPGHLIIQTHDSLLMEMPEDEGEEIAKDVASIMVAEFERAMARTWKSTGEFTVVPFAASVERWKFDES